MTATRRPRIEVKGPSGPRILDIDKDVVTIGRRAGHDVQLTDLRVSRDHAEIVRGPRGYVLRDRGSLYGTFVNGERVTEHVLAHGDRLDCGATGSELLFLLEERAPAAAAPAAIGGDLRQVAALLEALRGMGGGRVLDEVLTMVLDSAIEVTGAERGFIMLAPEEGPLELKLARAAGRVAVPAEQFATSRKVPEDVFHSGEERVVTDLLDPDVANQHMGTVALGIRHILCVPLRLVRYVEQAEAASPVRNIGVLYLDSRGRGSLLSDATRVALRALAAEAAVAIENARLYREALEKARIDQELQVASRIQRALLPAPVRSGPFYDCVAASQPCLAVGGDFFDYLALADGRLGVAIGDVTGKGPSAALLTAMLQGILAAEAFGRAEPSETMSRINHALIARSVDARFATAFLIVVADDGRALYCNAGHNPPLLFAAGGVRRLEQGGTIVGVFEDAQYEQEELRLGTGDTLVLYSDGVSEARNSADEEFGERRVREAAAAVVHAGPDAVLAAILGAVRGFAGGTPQNDDITVVVMRFQPRQG